MSEDQATIKAPLGEIGQSGLIVIDATTLADGTSCLILVFHEKRGQGSSEIFAEMLEHFGLQDRMYTQTGNMVTINLEDGDDAESLCRRFGLWVYAHDHPLTEADLPKPEPIISQFQLSVEAFGLSENVIVRFQRMLGREKTSIVLAVTDLGIPREAITFKPGVIEIYVERGKGVDYLEVMAKIRALAVHAPVLNTSGDASNENVAVDAAPTEEA